jgi:sugar phosphate isomerase/epimerase
MRQVLWSATLRRDVPLTERIAAAAAAGYAALSLFHEDFAQLGFDLAKARELRAKAADQGVDLSIMDGSTVWYPIDESRPLRSAPVSFDAAMAAAEAFGCTKLSAVPGFATGLDVPGLAEHFAIACDAARNRGFQVQLEFTPVPPVKGLADGWEIVRLADRSNGSLVFDTWHFFRSAADFELLEAIPGRLITGVQLSDGAAEIRESVIKDTFLHRLMPGEGVFDLPRVIDILRHNESLNDVGPEVLSREVHALAPAQAAALGMRAVEQLIAGGAG